MTLVVHIIDDYIANRELLEDLMESEDLPWVSHSGAEAFLETADRATLGCLILDIRMPGMSGLELLTQLKEDGIDVPVIMATAHGEIPMAIQAMKDGAFDFHEKPIDNQNMLESVHKALAHQASNVSERDRLTKARDAFAHLTPRERDVYACVVDGAMNKQIAYDLGISQRTVEVHRAKVMEKMAARNLADLIKMHIFLSEST